MWEKACELRGADGLGAQAYDEAVRAAVPMGRLGEPDDVAALAEFLMGPAATYITGQSIAVDGGLLLARG